jgi:hypothetical protein
MKTHGQTFGNDHERTDAHAAPLVKFLIFLAVVCTASFYSMNLLLKWFKEQPSVVPGNVQHSLADARTFPPEPRLEQMRDQWGHTITGVNEAHPELGAAFTAHNIHDLRAREAWELSTYGWVDQQQRIARIPIDEAIDLTLKRGLPVAPKPK